MLPEIAEIRLRLHAIALHRNDDDVEIYEIFQLLEDLRKKVNSSDESFFQQKQLLFQNALAVLDKFKFNNAINSIDICVEFENRAPFFLVDQNDPVIQSIKKAGKECCKEVFIIEHIVPLLEKISEFQHTNRRLGYLFTNALNSSNGQVIHSIDDLKNVEWLLTEHATKNLQNELVLYNSVFQLAKPCLFRLSDTKEDFENELLKINDYYTQFKNNFGELKKFNQSMCKILNSTYIQKENEAELFQFAEIFPLITDKIIKNLTDYNPEKLSIDEIIEIMERMKKLDITVFSMRIKLTIILLLTCLTTVAVRFALQNNEEISY